MLRPLMLASLMVIALTSCAPIYTLSPAVQESARRYSDVMDDFADQALLANVLRAKDYAPMNFNDLSSITGALSLSGTLGATFPVGPYVGIRPYPSSSSLGTYKDTLSPSVTGTTSPVINIGTLNTEGFMMTMIQPISTTYILSKWNTYPHELLLYLFVKSIRFPGEEEESAPKECLALDEKLCARRRVHVNNPDDPEAFADFQMLVGLMTEKASVFGGDVDMKSLMLLDPLGDPVPFGQTLQATTPIPTQSPSTSPTAPPAASARSAMIGNDPVAAGGNTSHYCVRISYAEAQGAETDLSPEECVDLKSGDRLRVNAPPKQSAAQRGYYVYVGPSAGSETKQLSSAGGAPLVSFKNNWEEPSSGILKGDPPPASPIGLFPKNSLLPSRDYYVELTYTTSTGTETIPSPEAVVHLKDNQVLSVSPPKAGTAGAIGYNVYVARTSHSETRQTVGMVSMTKSWREPVSGTQTGTSPPGPPGTSYQVSSDYNIIQTISALNDGQLHVGNAGCPEYLATAVHGNKQDVCPEGAESPFVRFYKEYTAQIVLCLRTGGDGRFYGHAIAPLSAKEREERRAFLELAKVGKDEVRKEISEITAKTKDERDSQEREIRTSYEQGLAQLAQQLKLAEATEGDVSQSDNETALSYGFMASPHGASPAAAAGTSAGGAAAPQGGGGGAGNAAAAGSSGGAMQTVTLALQPSRISAILHEQSCQADEIVLKTGTEEKYGTVSRRFTHIEWRSIAEVIQYLGAIARYQDHHSRAEKGAKYVEWESNDGPQRIFTYGRKRHPDAEVEGQESQTVDTEREDHEHGSFITTNYRSVDFRSPKRAAKDTTDHSLQSLALLNELISIAKISGTLPVSQPVQVLP
jgi:hypothetical protein